MHTFDKIAAPSLSKKLMFQLAKGIGKGVTWGITHPKVTIPVIGGAMASVAVADRVHDLYSIVNEERKRKIMKTQNKETMAQTEVLRAIQNSLGSKDKNVKPDNKSKLVIQPLS